MTVHLHSTRGPWMVDTSHQAIEIVNGEGSQVIGLAHEMGDAVLFASAPEMLDALIAIHEAMQEVEECETKDYIMTHISLAVEKVAAEADV